MDKKKIYIALMIILLMATLFRILPYALGYDTFVMGDTVREYQEVLHLLEEGSIDFGFIYGQYPVLHLLIAVVSLTTGLSPEILFHFLPQFFAALGAIPLFLLLKEITDDRVALLGAFLLASFGPNVWWSIKPVRETMGIFIFPFLVYLYYKTYKDDKYLIPLVITSIVAIFTHHWSLLMVLILLAAFILFVDNTKLLFIYLSTLSLGFIYIYYTLTAVQSFFGHEFIFFSLLLIALFSFTLLNKYLSQKNFKSIVKRIKSHANKLNDTTISLLIASIVLVTLALTLIFLGDYLVYSYSWYFFSSIVVLFFLATLGLLDSFQKYPIFTSACTAILAVYATIIAFGLFIGYQYFDPGRVAEFLIYPLIIPASLGIMRLLDSRVQPYVKSSFITVMLLLFFISSIFVLPLAYISGEADDIRSYLQFVPIEGLDAIEWAYDNSGILITDNTYVMALYDLEQYQEEKETKLYFAYVSKSDINAAILAEEVNIASIGSEIDLENLELIIQDHDLVYSNGWAYIYVVSEDEYNYLYSTNPYRWFWGNK